MDNWERFEKKINYEFRDKLLLKTALTHSSYVKEHGRGVRSNERLEFLGDAFFDAIIGEKLFRIFPDKEEGFLSRTRATLVCEKSLSDKAKMLNMGEYILLGKGEEHSGGRHRESILADAMEAVIGAVYLDGGFEAARSFILPFIPPLDKLSTGKFLLGDYKTVLQEIIQQNPEERVAYEISDESGQAHNKQFTANVLLNGQIIGTGKGKSKKEAEQSAAKEAISLMGYETN